MWEWKSVGSPILDCVSTTVNTKVFIRFLFFLISTIGRSPRRLWDLILIAFWIPLQSFSWFWEVLRMGWNFDVFLGPALGRPRFREQGQVRVKGRFVGYS